MMWQSVPISSICEGIYEGPHATPPSCDSGAYYLGIPSLTMDGQIDFSKVPFISKEDYIKWTKRVIPKYGDIVFTNEATLNLYARIPKGFYGCLGRRLGLVRPLKNKVDTDYLFYYFFSPFWRNVIAQKKVSGSTVERILMKKFPLFPVLLPPLPTQRRIASILSAYDNLIENNNKRIRLLEQMAENLYKEWFVRFRFPGHEKVEMENGLPKGWKVERMSDFCYVTDGTHDTPKPVDEGVPLITGKCISNGFIDFDEAYCISFDDHESIKRRSGLSTGDIIFSNIGTVGNCCIVDYVREFSVKNVIIFKPNDISKTAYLYYWMLSDSMQSVFSTQTNGASQQFVGLTFMRRYKILVPEQYVLSSFGKRIQPIIEQKKNLHRITQLLTRQRDLLLPRLMSGKLEVKE